MKKPKKKMMTIEDLGVKIDSLGTRMGRFEINLNDLTTTVGDLTTTVNDLAASTISAFSHVEGRIDELENNMNKRFDTVDKILFHNHENRLDHLEDDVRMIKTTLGK